MRNIYLTDGTAETFFTAVFDAYRDADAFLSPSRALQTALEDRFIPVLPSKEKSARVVKKIRSIDKNCLYDLDCALRTPAEEAKKLQDPGYQNKIAWAVAMGMISYMNQ